MMVQTSGQDVQIRYAEPPSNLNGLGVVAGTVLFKGKVGDGYIDGMANLLERRCGPIEYFVYGDITPGRISS